MASSSWRHAVLQGSGGRMFHQSEKAVLPGERMRPESALFITEQSINLLKPYARNARFSLYCSGRYDAAIESRRGTLDHKDEATRFLNVGLNEKTNWMVWTTIDSTME